MNLAIYKIIKSGLDFTSKGLKGFDNANLYENKCHKTI